MKNRESISCRAVNALTACWESFAARKARVFKRAVFNLAAYIDNNREVKHDVYGKRQTAKIILILLTFSLALK